MSDLQQLLMGSLYCNIYLDKEQSTIIREVVCALFVTVHLK